MSKLIAFVMYLLWTATIIAVLAATFTNFHYEDFNLLALLLLIVTLTNTFFVVTRGK
ncbi:MAG: hypothetical protein Q8Q08_06555 [Candidatus Omnitrophota bacterium]|nr:hypothetical protein [Candidatus Omnitrophota bacterium]MDZ4243272.1 hypothetical protein [Candidatus Omnitrophota bacterium]